MTYFVTGIGTDVGKTVVSAILVEALKADYWKPIQSGDLDWTDSDKVRSWVQNPSSVYHPSAYRLHTPMSPHAAAKIDGVQIELAKIKRPQTSRALVIEGAGGLLVPLNNTQTITDLIDGNDRIVLVSRNYLGSINHTLLSVAYLKQRGFSRVGIFFNGPRVPSTESVIIKMTGLSVLGYINEEHEINAAVINRYARTFADKLQNF